MPDENLLKLHQKTYLRILENSVGCRLFNSNIVRNKNTNEEYDVLDDGTFSCAFFVSGILTLFGQIDRMHSTVETVSKKLTEDPNWEEVSLNDIKPGDVLVWEKVTFKDGTSSDHNGFALNKNEAVSTSYIEKSVTRHHITFGVDKNNQPNRKITKIFRNKLLTS
ncbi:MAG: hypothetical protein PHU86_00135 [Patescibacteria group bacterium]|jgi:hypothetical protein|nr:hypothetical protein [Patescibacteria group bacterium]